MNTPATDSDPQISDTFTTEKPAITVVGIGASAGGLEALIELAQQLDPSVRQSYIVAQHLSPVHSSMLAKLIDRETQLRVVDITHDTNVRAGVIYITPPNFDVVYKRGLLKLSRPLSGIGPKPNINLLFNSLAEELAEKSIAVILSGTGSDGSIGCVSVKAAGGTVIVQDPKSAKYDGMPVATIQKGFPLIIKTPEQIGIAINSKQPEHLYINQDEHVKDADYAYILNILKKKLGMDFSQYKISTIRRRITRRMALLGLNSKAEYIHFLERNESELQQLGQDLLISVTAFFRDDNAFQKLYHVLKKKLAAFDTHKTFRIWVSGCATGEEAYSLSVIIKEISTELNKEIPYRIFATDIDRVAIQKARKTSYPATLVERLRPSRVEDYFTKDNSGSYIVNKSVRDHVVFAEHNVISDAPFSNIDLISCRNLLIYFSSTLQKTVIERFQYSLVSDGLLFLGQSENIEKSWQLFDTIDKKSRIFQNRRNLPARIPEVDIYPPLTNNTANQVVRSELSKRNIEHDLKEQFDLETKAIVAISEDNHVLYINKAAKPFFTLPHGIFGISIFDLVLQDLRAALRATIYKTRRTSSQSNSGTIQAVIDEKAILVDISTALIYPNQDSLAICFDQTESSTTASATLLNMQDRHSDIIRELEYELTTSRKNLNAVIEELETSNEELQSLNEEMQSANEELQSTNEELQTSNEELQSANQELLTLNEELQIKSSELRYTLNELENIQESIRSPLLLVDSDLIIRRFSRKMEQLIGRNEQLLEGVCIANINWRFDIQIFLKNLNKCLKNREETETLVKIDNKAYTVRISPFLDEENLCQGAILLFVDVSVQRTVHEALKDNEKRLANLVETLSDGLLILSETFVIKSANALARQIFDSPQLEDKNLSQHAPTAFMTWLAEGG